jgi:hypothetical protein
MLCDAGATFKYNGPLKAFREADLDFDAHHSRTKILPVLQLHYVSVSVSLHTIYPSASPSLTLSLSFPYPFCLA